MLRGNVRRRERDGQDSPQAAFVVSRGEGMRGLHLRTFIARPRAWPASGDRNFRTSDSLGPNQARLGSAPPPRPARSVYQGFCPVRIFRSLSVRSSVLPVLD